MKKVMGVALAASLVAGMAFADVAVNLNGQLKSNLYHFKETDKGDKEAYTFDLDSASEHGGSGDFADELKFSGKTDYAGVTLVTKWNDTSSTVANNNYNAFLQFGGLKFTFGKFNSRYVDPYGITVGEAGLLDGNQTKYGLYKLGNVTNGVNTRMIDASNTAAINGSRAVSLLADYTFDVADGKLLVKGGLITSSYKSDTEDAADKKYQKSGYVVEADFENDSLKLQTLVKVPTEKSLVFGAYVEPKLMKELPVVVGFTYGQDTDDEGGNKYGNASNNKFTAFAVDGRVGYQFNDQAKLSTFVKYESVSPDKTSDTETALSLGAEVSYIVNDLATVFADVSYVNADLEDGGQVVDDCTISFRPGVVLTAGKDAKITAAFQYDNHTKTKANDGTKTEYSIPVIFRVKL